MVRVHQLARELGVRVSVVLQAARAERIRYLRTASSPVPDADADAIRARVRHGTAPPRGGPSSDPGEPADGAEVPAAVPAVPTVPAVPVVPAFGWDLAAAGRVDPEVAATAAALGVEFSGGQATYQQPVRPRPDGAAARLRPDPDPVVASPPDPVDLPDQPADQPAQPEGMAALIREQWRSVTVAESERLAAGYAAKGVAVEAARPYWEAGLGPYDLDAIAQCIRNGLEPADLALLIDGRSVVNRLRGGEPVQVLLVQLPR